jgi:protein BCP1
MIYTDFVFSGLRDSYFHNIKNLIKPIFEFDSVNVSNLADFILAQKEDVGTVIKNEDEEETKNPNVDVFAIFSIVPLIDNNLAPQLLECFKLKLEKYASPEDRLKGLNILKSNKLALLISERVINLPQEAVPITLDFLVKEIGECREDENYDGKFEFDYIITISKFVKRLFPIDNKKVKKKNTEKTTQPEECEILHYKYETEHFLKHADVNITYKIPYDQMNLDYLENKNEPQYFCILFIKSKSFFSVVQELNKK